MTTEHLPILLFLVDLEGEEVADVPVHVVPREGEVVRFFSHFGSASRLSAHSLDSLDGTRWRVLRVDHGMVTSGARDAGARTRQEVTLVVERVR